MNRKTFLSKFSFGVAGLIAGFKALQAKADYVIPLRILTARPCCQGDLNEKHTGGQPPTVPNEAPGWREHFIDRMKMAMKEFHAEHGFYPGPLDALGTPHPGIRLALTRQDMADYRWAAINSQMGRHYSDGKFPTDKNGAELLFGHYIVKNAQKFGFQIVADARAFDLEAWKRHWPSLSNYRSFTTSGRQIGKTRFTTIAMTGIDPLT